MVYRRARGGVPSKTTFLPINNKVAKKVPVETFFDTIFPSYTPAERIHLSQRCWQLLKEQAERTFGLKPRLPQRSEDVCLYKMCQSFGSGMFLEVAFWAHCQEYTTAKNDRTKL